MILGYLAAAFSACPELGRDDDLSVVTLASICVRPQVPESRKQQCVENRDHVVALP